MTVSIKRAYDKPGAQDGTRILVDGLWPRGMKKEELEIAQWIRAIAPSPELRKWYGHDPKRWKEFRERYRRELSESPREKLLKELVSRVRKGKVTLVFGARDAEHCNATVIAEMIREKL